MMKSIFFIFSMIIASDFVNTYKTGAPVEVCQSMIPEHGVPPQKTTSPYLLSVDKTKIKSGEKLSIKLFGTKAEPNFKGFLLQARNSANESIGTFTQTPGTNVINCPPGTQNAITHANPDNKSLISVTWTATDVKPQELRIWATVAKDGGKFWVGQRSRPIAVV